jgi:Sulfotransferase domain
LARERRYRLPEFMGVGPGRTGTSWLHNALAGHVDLPLHVKETQFFNHYYDKGIDWYAYHFRHASGERPVAEICPYFNHPKASERIHLHLPDCKFICTIRDPVDHAYSAYKLLRRYVWARGSFEEVLASRPHMTRGNRYAAHLRRWFDQCGRENMLVTWYDDLRADPQAYIDRVCDFVGLARFRLDEHSREGREVNSFARAPKNRHLAQNARHVMYWLKERRFYRVIEALGSAGVWDFCYGRGEPYPPLTPQQELRLRERFRPEIEALEELLGCDLSRWKRPCAERAAAGDLVGRPQAATAPAGRPGPT